MSKGEDEFCRSRSSINTGQLVQIVNNVKVHEYADSRIRSVMFEGQRWVVFSDVCKVLGYKNPRHQRKKIPPNEQRKVEIGLKNTLATCINENGFRRYGISLRPDAMRALYEKFAPGGTKASRRKKDRHRLTGRIACRLEDADMEALQQRMKADGYATAQELMTALVRRYLAGEVEA